MLPVPIFTASENDNAIFDRCEAEVSSSAGVALISVGAISVDDVLNEKVVYLLCLQKNYQICHQKQLHQFEHNIQYLKLNQRLDLQLFICTCSSN